MCVGVIWRISLNASRANDKNAKEQVNAHPTKNDNGDCHGGDPPLEISSHVQPSVPRAPELQRATDPEPSPLGLKAPRGVPPLRLTLTCDDATWSQQSFLASVSNAINHMKSAFACGSVEGGDGGHQRPGPCARARAPTMPFAENIRSDQETRAALEATLQLAGYLLAQCHVPPGDDGETVSLTQVCV